MEIAGRFARSVYGPYRESNPRPELPSVALVVATFRVAGLLHDVGHGPFSHLLDHAYFKPMFGLTHESIGAEIIRGPLAEIIRGIRRTPDGDCLQQDEEIDPQIVSNIVRKGGEDDLSGIWKALYPIIRGAYDADKMDFLLRDGALCGMQAIHSPEADRLMSTTFIGHAPDGAPVLLLDNRSKITLLTFLRQRHLLTYAVYYHRTVKAIERMIEPAVVWGVHSLLDGCSPVRCLDQYIECDEIALHAYLQAAAKSPGQQTSVLRTLDGWGKALSRDITWKEVWASEKFEDELQDFDRPDEQYRKKIQKMLYEKAPEGVRDTLGTERRIWVDIPVISPPEEVLNVLLWNARSERPEQIDSATLRCYGVPRHWINYHVYLDSKVMSCAGGVVETCHRIWKDHREQETSW